MRIKCRNDILDILTKKSQLILSVLFPFLNLAARKCQVTRVAHVYGLRQASAGQQDPGEQEGYAAGVPGPRTCM